MYSYKQFLQRDERTLLRLLHCETPAGDGEDGGRKNELKEQNRHVEWDVAARMQRGVGSGTLHSSGRGDGLSSSSAAEDAAERRLGRGRKPPARRRPCCCCCEAGGGRTSDASARLIWSPPSTAAMRTSGFAIDARRGALSLLDTGGGAA